MKLKAIYHSDTEEGKENISFHKGQIKWARGVLAAPSVTYQNGRESHACANEVLERSEDALINYMAIQVY